MSLLVLSVLLIPVQDVCKLLMSADPAYARVHVGVSEPNIQVSYRIYLSGVLHPRCKALLALLVFLAVRPGDVFATNGALFHGFDLVLVPHQLVGVHERGVAADDVPFARWLSLEPARAEDVGAAEGSGVGWRLLSLHLWQWLLYRLPRSPRRACLLPRLIWLGLLGASFTGLADLLASLPSSLSPSLRTSSTGLCRRPRCLPAFLLERGFEGSDANGRNPCVPLAASLLGREQLPSARVGLFLVRCLPLLVFHF